MTMPARSSWTGSLICLFAAACEHDRTFEAKPAPHDAGVPELAKCELADDKIELGTSLALRFHGKVFASIGLLR